MELRGQLEAPQKQLAAAKEETNAGKESDRALENATAEVGRLRGAVEDMKRYLMDGAKERSEQGTLHEVSARNKNNNNNWAFRK